MPSTTKAPWRVTSRWVSGVRKFEGVCLRHKRPVKFHGLRGLGTHNGVRIELHAHLREHRVEDAKRAARDAARRARKAA